MAQKDLQEENTIRQLQEEEEIQNILESAGNKLTVIEFWAPWCISCKKILPFVQELSAKYENVLFVRVNIDDFPEIASNYGVSRVPSLVFIKNKEVIDLIEDGNKQNITEAIEINK